MKRECSCQSSRKLIPAERAKIECGLEAAVVLHTQSQNSQRKTKSSRMHFKKVHKPRLRLNNKGCLCSKMWKISMQTKHKGPRIFRTNRRRFQADQSQTLTLLTLVRTITRDIHISEPTYISFILYSLLYMSIHNIHFYNCSYYTNVGLLGIDEHF